MASSAVEKLEAAIASLGSADPKVASKGLAFLLAKAADGFESSPHAIALAAEMAPKLVAALGELMDVVNPMGVMICPPPSDDAYYAAMLTFSDFPDSLPSVVQSVEFKFLGRYVDDNPILLSCLTILRNISFELASEPLVAFSAPVLRHLVSLVCLACQSNAMSETAYLAFDMLSRLAHRIDFFGKRRSQFSQQVLESLHHDRPTRLRLAAPFSAATTGQFVECARMMLPALCQILCRSGLAKGARGRSLNRAAGLRGGGAHASRALVVAALELLSRLAANPDNHACLLQCPHALVHGLVQLLVVNNTRGEAIVAEAHAVQGDPFGRFRPPAAVLLPRTSRPPSAVLNYAAVNVFATDYVDTDIRDLALDLLTVLCRLSRENALGLVPGAVPYLLRAAQAMGTSDGSGPLTALAARPESVQKAVALLQLLVLMPESDQAFRVCKTELMLSSCRDDALAELVLNKGHPAFVSLVDNELQTGAVIMDTSAALSGGVTADAGVI